MLLLPGAACATGISRQLLDEAGIPVLFEDLVTNPSEYRGRVVVLGGYILEIQNEPGGRFLTIIQAPLGWRNKPKSRDLSQGRFFVTIKKFLDPEVYAKDRRLTVGGIVVGVREQLVGGATYHFPAIEAQELELWAEQAYPVGPCYPAITPGTIRGVPGDTRTDGEINRRTGDTIIIEGMEPGRMYLVMAMASYRRNRSPHQGRSKADS